MTAAAPPLLEIRDLVTAFHTPAGRLPGVTVYHAGTARRPDGTLEARGGRVLAITALGADLAEARQRAYAGVDAIAWPEGFCRRDIGWRALS